MKPKLVVITGAGISAESGIPTFRGEDGFWNNFPIEAVCTEDAWDSDPLKVNQFYNTLRNITLEAQPNKAHTLLAAIEDQFDVTIITTNVDDLHERAGSSNILHLHGQLTKARPARKSLSNLSDYLLKPFLVSIGPEGIKDNQEDGNGNLLRPHIVFFGEDVPNLEDAKTILRSADYLLIIGTTLSVYPAASLINYGDKVKRTFYIDPTDDISIGYSFPCTFINKRATVGVQEALTTIAKLLD